MSIPIDKISEFFPKEGSTSSRGHSIKDEYPQLKRKVFIVGNCYLSGAIELFAKAGCKAAPSLKESELVVFLGGEDVDPSLYGEKPHRTTYFNKARDEREMDVFAEALSLGIPMFGICRGMQFIHVMGGGKLHQNVQNHTCSHNIVDTEGNVIRASSMHHQMCIVNDDLYPLAFAEEKGHGSPYEGCNQTMSWKNHEDLEAAVYPDLTAIAVQGHPEVGGYPEYSAWCLSQIGEFLEQKYLIGHGSKARETINPDLPFLNRSVASS